MNVNKWTVALAGLGLVSFLGDSRAEEKVEHLLTALPATTLSGYVNTSMNWNLGTGNSSVPNYVYNTPAKQDGFNLNVVDITLEKALDEAQWAAGYKVQLWVGPDAVTFGSTLDSIGDSSSFAVKQAYVALRAPVGNGLDFKVGVFDGLLGYESHDAGKNPNFTRAYGLALTPHTHTGVEMSYQFSPLISAAVAVGNTVGPVINQKANPPKAESFKAYTGLLALSAPEEWGFVGGSTLYAGVLNGFNAGSGWDQTSWYAGLTLNTPVKALKVGASYAYLGTTDFGIGTNNYANAVAGYASFQLTEKLSLHGRAEYIWTDTTLFGGYSDIPLPLGDGVIHGNNELFALTGTIQYDLWKNVLSRIEVRWDHLAGDGEMSTGTGGFGGASNNTRRNFVLVAANIIYQF